jgi:integrase/recombinase XerD
MDARGGDLPPAWASALARFREQVATTRSKNTADTYERGVRLFFAWLSPRPFALNLPRDTLQAFAVAGIREGKAGATMRAYVAGVKKFLGWLAAQGGRVPTFGAVDWPREQQVQPQALPPNVLDMYLAWVRANATEPYRTAMLLLPHCGLRISELVGLRLSDLKAEGRGLILVVRAGKGNKWRQVPVLPSFAPVLSEYLRGWRSLPSRARNPHLFPARGKLSGMDRRSLTAKLTACSRALNHPLTAHTMRRQYATALHKGGVPLATISRVLGHTEPKTTSNHYLAMTGGDLVAATRKVRL